MKNLKENYSIYVNFQIPLRIKITILVKLLAYQNCLIIGSLSTWKKQIRGGCRRTKDLQSRVKLFVDQTILSEENPTIFKHRFRTTRKKIKNLITAVKVRTRFVYFYGSNCQDLFYKLIASGARSRCPIWIFFWYFKNLKFASCLGKGEKYY